MNRQFRDVVFRAIFKPTELAVETENRLRTRFGLDTRYEAARLALGRSLCEASAAPAIPQGTTYGKTLSGEFLFGDDVDLWISLFIIDGKLGEGAAIEDFRALVEAHWARGSALLKEELDQSDGNELQLLHRLASFLPTLSKGGFGSNGSAPQGSSAEVKVKVGSISKTYPGEEPIELVLNGPGASPHVAFMGKIGSGKTRTGIEMAMEIASTAKLPFLLIDPKGEFSQSGVLSDVLSRFNLDITPIDVGQTPIPLNFLPSPEVGSASIANAATQFRDSIALCCRGSGDIQKDLLRVAIDKTIRAPGVRDLEMIKTNYRAELQAQGKGHDSIMSRLNELTTFRCFDPVYEAQDFFQRSWVLSLNAIGTEEVKRLVILLVIDSLKNHILRQPDAPLNGGYRSLRHLLFIDEARRILAEKKYQSLVDIVRQGRSKGSMVILLSQDPSDFEGQADDFTNQLGSVISFACSQSSAGLKALEGAYGRKVQPKEFSDTYLPKGVAFVKLPGREPERIKCWD